MAKPLPINMIQKLIHDITQELDTLGYTPHSSPPIINRINITLNLAKLALIDGHKLTTEDKKWCSHYAQYIYFFDSDEMEKLGDLYFELTELLQKECF